MSRTARPNISRPPKDGPAYIVASVSIVHPRISKWDAFFGVTDAYGSTAAVQAGVPATAASGGVRTSVRRRLAPCGSRGPLVRARQDDVEDRVLDLVVRGRISRCPPGEAFLD
jgi:hypothetical protein